jgi:hypothetical protein
MSSTKQQARGGLETIDIRGKAYVTVAERIKAVTDFENLEENRYEIEKWERFEVGGKHFLTCHIIVGTDETLTELKTVLGYRVETRQVPVKLLGKRYSGTSQISFTGGVNATSGYENAETSALGRALGFAGIGVLEGVASADEITKANADRAVEPPTQEAKPEPPKKLDQEQIAKLLSLAKNRGQATKEAAVSFINMALTTDDFTQLSPAHFEEYKKAVISTPTEPS